jgi:hypothetical protein
LTSFFFFNSERRTKEQALNVGTFGCRYHFLMKGDGKCKAQLTVVTTLPQDYIFKHPSASLTSSERATSGNPESQST